MRLVNLTSNPDSRPALMISNSSELEVHSAKNSGNTISVNHELLLTNNPGKLLYSIRDAAKTLGVSYEFVRAKVYSGYIQAQAFGSRRLIHISEMSRLLSEGLPS
jgi:excisionase family DNA binding protein